MDVTNFNFFGTIIEESLADKAVFRRVKILSTKVEAVGERHKTPWLKQWTLRKVEILESDAEEIAKELSLAIEKTHQAWYADFKNPTTHYIIYPNKIFKIDRKSKEQYQEAKQYGMALGIPEYQLDFSSEIK